MTLATRVQHIRFTATCLGIAFGLACAQPAAAQHATYALAWGAPVATTQPYGDNLNFDCSVSNSTYRLFLTVTPTEDITGLLAIDCRFGLLGEQPTSGGPNPVPRHPISPFWHFEEGGCNAGGLDIHVPTASIINGFHAVFPSNSLFWAYAADYGNLGHGAIAITVIQSQGQAVNLVKSKTYIVCELDFSMCARMVCDGCGDPFCLFADYVRLEQDQSSADAVATSSYYTGINTSCTITQAISEGTPRAAASTRPIAGMTQSAFAARLDPAFKSAPLSTLECDGVPAKRRSWGTLKLLYR